MARTVTSSASDLMAVSGRTDMDFRVLPGNSVEVDFRTKCLTHSAHQVFRSTDDSFDRFVSVELDFRGVDSRDEAKSEIFLSKEHKCLGLAS